MLCFKNFVFSQPQVEELCGLQTMDLEDVVNYGPQADLFSTALALTWFLPIYHSEHNLYLHFLPSIFLCWYRSLLALQRRIPSMMEAWFSSSDITASSAPSNTSNRPALASKQLAYKMESSFPWNLAIFSSSSLCISCYQLKEMA